MISYERIDKSEDIDLNKGENSAKCIVSFVVITILKTLVSNINLMFVMDVMIFL